MEANDARNRAAFHLAGSSVALRPAPIYRRRRLDAHRPPPATSESPRDAWSGRDAAVCALLDAHPVTAAMLAHTGLFTGRSKALLRLKRLARRGRVRFVGTVRRHDGPPEHVYCRWTPKADQLAHELAVSEVCLALGCERVNRGPKVADRDTAPDAEAWVGGVLYYLELDCGTMRLRQIEDRFRRYEACPHFCLWVCPDERRKRSLRERAGRIAATALFATMADVLTDPRGPVWEDAAAGRAALPLGRV